ncbi:MAG: phytoene desaturase family protein, partial [Nocardioidaceae bacterium]
MTTGTKQRKYDVVIVGGGHNGLVSAAYLAKAGLSVLVLERLAHTGGAAISTEAFEGLEARLSRYSYLVSLLPQQIISDLELDLELKSRVTASYTPVVRDGKHTGLLVERPEGTLTAESFRSLTGSDKEYDAWKAFYAEVTDFAQAVAPTLLEPLRTEKEMRELVEADTWDALIANPLSQVIEERFENDTVRGVVATDALIGTFAAMNDPSLIQNRCFLYHVVGNGTGEWRVPVGGMGAVTDALADAARRAGAEIVTGAGVSKIEADGTSAEVLWHDGRLTHNVEAKWVLSNVAPWVLQVLLGEEPSEAPKGSQLKVNFLHDRLP